MAIIITFEAIPESHCKPEDDLEFVILKGNKGDILLRETMEDNLEGYPEIVYDTESSKVFRRPNRLSLLQGALKGTVSWEGDEIEASDIERFKALNKNSFVDTLVPYWEGPIILSGSHQGFGYLEMTGY